MEDHEYQRPEGKLLGAAMARTGKSVRKIAAGMGISDSRLRHIVNGYQPVGRGQKVEVVAPAATLARIADKLGITPNDLVAAGREDAAELLRTMPPEAQTEAEENPFMVLKELLRERRENEEWRRNAERRLLELEEDRRRENGPG